MANYSLTVQEVEMESLESLIFTPLVATDSIDYLNDGLVAIVVKAGIAAVNVTFEKNAIPEYDVAAGSKVFSIIANTITIVGTLRRKLYRNVADGKAKASVSAACEVAAIKLE